MSNNSEGGIGLCGVLFIVFLVLKLTDNIDWSWCWVFAPLWMPCGLILAILIIIAFFAIVGGVAIGSAGSRISKKVGKKKNVKWQWSTPKKDVIELSDNMFKDVTDVTEAVEVEILDDKESESSEEKEIKRGGAYKLWNFLRSHPKYSDWDCSNEIKYREDDGILMRD